jgi:hypothetical protein
MTAPAAPAYAPGRAPIDGTARNLVLVGLVIGAALDIAYWTLWFTARDVVASETTEAYYAFEQAFPVADLWLLVLIVGAFVTVLQRRPAALFWLLVGGGAGVYLGCMDVLYDIEHRIFTSGAGGLIEIVIVTATFVLSISLLRWSWRRRHTLLALEA